MEELLLGAAIAFVGSVFGSVIIGRLELKRQTRIELYRTLLPDLRTRVESRHDFTDALEDLRKAAVFLSRCEVRLIREVDQLQAPVGSGGLSTYDTEAREGRRARYEKIVEKLDELADVITAKLRWWPT